MSTLSPTGPSGYQHAHRPPATGPWPDSVLARFPVPVAKRIDVVIPAYNAAATIMSAVASIQRQTIADIGIIVINDGSSDGTAALLNAMAEQDPRIIVVHRPNGGIVDALNDGLARVEAPLVARFDADDIALPDRLEQQLAFLERHSDHVAVGGNVWHIDEHGERRGTTSHFLGSVAPDPRWVPSKEPYLLHPFLMVRTDALRAIGGYRYVFHAEDTDLYWRLTQIGGLYNIPEMLGEYRIHSGSVTSASLVNGRISAINSQLAALSALRRGAGKPDLVFGKEMLAAYHRCGHVEAMLALWDDRLTGDERGYLAIAVAAKLMELSAYRPYELEAEDCRFIRRAILRNGGRVRPKNAPRLAAKCARTFMRLIRGRHYAAAAALACL